MWESAVRSPSTVPKLSTANGLLYFYEKEPNALGIDAWYLTAVDFRTGERRWRNLTGTGPAYDTNWAPITIGPDGTAYVGVFNGMVAARDTARATGVLIGRGHRSAHPMLAAMEQREVVKRVIGILTEAREMQRLLEADLEREDLDAGAGAVTALLNETMPHIAIPDDFSVEEVVTVVGREVGGAVEQLVSAFTLAFTMLAQVHDSGQTDVSSADVLQDLALRVEAGGPEDEDGGPVL